eukprot:GHVP01049399.1.p1 GENE.GHVP01049399.1~~GHVP01049399.1.p1  ORF type:complete len:124 (+),score=3.97 GHVP01049399.1:186-557(+)
MARSTAFKKGEAQIRMHPSNMYQMYSACLAFRVIDCARIPPQPVINSRWLLLMSWCLEHHSEMLKAMIEARILNIAFCRVIGLQLLGLDCLSCKSVLCFLNFGTFSNFRRVDQECVVKLKYYL